MNHIPALDDGVHQWSYAQLRSEVSTLASTLRASGTRVVATLMDNMAAWVVADQAASHAGIVHVPLPRFFTREQAVHVLAAAGVDALLAQSGFLAELLPGLANRAPQAHAIAGQKLELHRLQARIVPLPAGTAKITFTSGTTGTPKGVCLGLPAMARVASGLLRASEPLKIGRHLCALPFALLLENIAGVMAPMARGVVCIVPPLRQIGLSGSSAFDPEAFQAALIRHHPHSTILLPQMLAAWSRYLEGSGQPVPPSLRLVAVGGAAVGAAAITRARALGIPAYEGYGLSEGASVQTLNLPGADRPGTAGRPLPHARVRIAHDGEIEVAGSLFLGYLGAAERQAPRAWWPTGDLGQIDSEGYLHVHGRKKNVLVTSFGRNVSPEWVESALRSESAIAQAVVYGEAQPALSAVLWPARTDIDDATLHAAVTAANARLPDYARVARWVRGRAAFHADTGLATANGRPQRAVIEAMHAGALLTNKEVR